MGIWDRLKIFVPLLIAALAATELSAQLPGYPPTGGPAMMAGQGYSATAYQGMPQSFQSHPAISPFDNAMEQHFTSDGLWFRRFLSGMGPRNRFYFNADFIRTQTRRQRGTVGHPNAPSFSQEGVDDNPPIDVTFPDGLFFEPFPVYSARDVDPGWANGIRLRGGVENQQGWGFQWNAFHNGEARGVMDLAYDRESNQLHFFDARVLEESGGVANGSLARNLRHINERDIIFTQILNQRIFDAADVEEFGVSGSTFDILDRHIFPYASLPIQTFDPTQPYGFPMLFDLYFTEETQIESWGTGAHFSFGPLMEKGSLKIRPIAGGRYYEVDELWGFQGGFSGLFYGFSAPNGIDDDDDFVVDNVDENGTPNFSAVIPDGSQENLVRSYTRSQVKSNMAGPELGIEYIVGDRKGIRVTGHTKVGALFNRERATLEGDNIGSQADTAIDITTLNIVRAQMFDTTTAGGQRTQNFFTDAKETTHISPMFEQQLNAEVPIFSHVPVLRDWWQLEHAKLRLGWNFLLIGAVADPSESIEWVANPRAGIFPYLKSKRRVFYQNTLSAGINWDF